MERVEKGKGELVTLVGKRGILQESARANYQYHPRVPSAMAVMVGAT